MTMECMDALPLVPAYLDGELSEAQAGLLRQHLIGCQTCRTGVQDGKALGRWFVRDADAAVPPGFAARVARRAFAGDTGRLAPGPLPAVAEEGGRLLQFVLRATAIAAGVLLLLAISLRRQELPAGSALHADDRPAMTVDQIVRELERLDPPADRPTLEPAAPARAPVRRVSTDPPR